jgi:2-polyprenyl-3-methyl-5-hydroxy-6-metoxy-1,4-benzoquinol methylase
MWVVEADFPASYGKRGVVVSGIDQSAKCIKTAQEHANFCN